MVLKTLKKKDLRFLMFHIISEHLYKGGKGDFFKKQFKIVKVL